MNLCGMLLAALRYVREEHPWLGRKGAELDAPGDYPPGTAFKVSNTLPIHEEPLTFDACLASLCRALDLEVFDAPCARRAAWPRAYPYHLDHVPEALRELDLFEHVAGVVADEGWLSNPERRNEVLAEVVPPNDERASFVELDAETACTLACFLFAGPERRRAHKGYRAAAAAFVRLFGRGTRCFAHLDLEGGALADPFVRGSAWSQYDAAGYGSWGQTLALVVTDGMRAAYVDAVWDVSSE
jgi:hypothetical protein